MSRPMTRVVPVRLTTDEINCYATIMRAMVTATTAALRLGDDKLAKEFSQYKDSANARYNLAIGKHCDEKK